MPEKIIINYTKVDFIDLQSHHDGEYKFIMMYEYHLTKFVQLRAVKTETIDEVDFLHSKGAIIEAFSGTNLPT